MVETGEAVGNPTVRLCEIRYDTANCGFNVTKSRWDPYPWVSTVDPGSPAAMAGVLAGDCLLEVNGEDMLGLRVVEVAARIRARGDRATVMLWNAGAHSLCSSENLCCGPMPINLQRLTTCMSSIIEALECPICLETIPPPAHQCANGHLVCNGCRMRTERCPVCRMRFFRGRSLLADQVFSSMIDAFDLRKESEAERSKLLHQRIYGSKKKEKKYKPEIKINFLSPTNKFLTRIMGSGKSSSVENLSGDFLNEHKFDIDFGGLKAKSLSSNEIFHGESQSQPISRASSVLSNRPGSGLLDVSDAQFPRPASYHGSAEDLHSRLYADFGLELSSDPDREFCCPLNHQCLQKVQAVHLKAHLFQHNIPIIQFNKSKFSIKSNWLEDSIIIIECYNTIFFIRAVFGERLWIWTVDNKKANYSARINFEGCEISLNVVPLIDLSTRDNNTMGIPFELVRDRQVTVDITINCGKS